MALCSVGTRVYVFSTCFSCAVLAERSTPTFSVHEAERSTIFLAERDKTVRNLRTTVKKINPITPRTTTMSQWITLPIDLLVTIATVSTTAIDIASNAID